MPRIVNLGDFRLLGIDRPTGTIRAELDAGDLHLPAGGSAAARQARRAGAPPAAAGARAR